MDSERSGVSTSKKKKKIHLHEVMELLQLMQSVFHVYISVYLNVGAAGRFATCGDVSGARFINVLSSNKYLYSFYNSAPFIIL
jgi:hypothetical protein